MTDQPETIETVAAPAPAGTKTLSRSAMFAIVGLSAAVLAAVVVIVLLSLPKGESDLAGAPALPIPTPTATPSVSPTTKPSATPSATPSPTQAPVVSAPVPVDPAPAQPAPVEPAPAPALPAPPAPVFVPAVTSMSAVRQGACTASTWVTVSWTTTNAMDKVSEVNVRSGGGTPIFNETWTQLAANGSVSIKVDCTRPIWFFKLTVFSESAIKTALLTFANGADQGWSSN